jgi:PAS domain S-box-containing protein
MKPERRTAGSHPYLELGALAIGMVLLLFATWSLVEWLLGPSLSDSARNLLHLVRGVSSSLIVAAIIVFVTGYWGRKNRQLEDRLARQERQFARALKDSIDAIIGVDSSGRVVYWNRGAEQLYGYRPDEIVGREFEELLPEVARHRALAGIPPGSGPDPVEEFLSQRLTRNDENISVIVTRVTAEGEMRECLGCQAIEQNLLELRELERQLSHSEKLATLGEMAAGLAHEIKNPLAGISGAIQVLGDSLPAGDDRREVVEKVLEQVRRIDATVRDLLAYARPRAARFEPTDLEQLIEGNLRVVSLLPGDRVRIVREFQEKLPRVSVDPELFGQLLSNLFINAIHAMPKGGTLFVRAAETPSGIEISVRDTGHGIPEANLKRIFDPFYTTKSRGTGLGLSICQRVVEMHRGSLSVSSQVGEGTEFLVTLPASRKVRGSLETGERDRAPAIAAGKSDLRG